MKKAKHPIIKKLYKFTLLLIGSITAAVGLEIFLVPNNIIDGGIVGISIIANYLTDIPLGLFTFVLNIPFLIIGYKHIGKSFVVYSLFSISVFSAFLEVFKPVPRLTGDVLLATIFGGIILGVGVGIIIRFGGSLDGSEIIAIILSRRSVLSVGQIVMIINVVIFSCAALILGWDKALYSMLAYFVAHKAIDTIIDGFDESKAVIVVSDSGEEIADAILARLGRGVTFLSGHGAYSKSDKIILYSVITRLEVSKLMSIINDFDENAFVTINDVSDVMGGEHKKRPIH